MANIDIKSVFKAYGDHPQVIRDVSLHIADGEFCVFVGPSGCGKSTLLRMVAGLEEISAGELYIGGKNVTDEPASRRGVAMVFQSYALFPHMTVRENLSFGLRLAKMPQDQIDKKVNDAARVLQLEKFLERKPKALSGGQRQRVAIGRAIVREPGVFLFDEPLSNLDAALRVQTRIEIAKLHHDFGKASMIYVTHDQVEAMTLADRILLLNAGETVQREGSVAQCGSPLELYNRPCSLFVAGFIGSPKMNFMPGTLVQGRSDHASVKLDSGEVIEALVDASALKPGARVTVGIRPEHAELGANMQHVVREVQYQERLGESTFLYVDSGKAGEPWIAKAPGKAHANPGQRLAIGLPPAALHLFDGDGHALTRVVTEADMQLPEAPARPGAGRDDPRGRTSTLGAA